MDKIYKCENIDFNNLEYTKPRKVGTLYYSDINYNGNPLFIQTQRLKLKSKTDNLNLKKPTELKFTADDNIYNLFNNLDNKNVNVIYENSKNWFSKQLRLEDSENMYKNISKPLIQNKLPEIKFKLPIDNGKLLSKIYNQEKIDIDISDIKENQECVLIIHIRGIKFFKSYYICDYYISHIKTYSKLNYLIPDDCIIENENSKEEDYDILDEEIIHKENKKKKAEDEIKELEKQINLLKQNIN